MGNGRRTLCVDLALVQARSRAAHRLVKGEVWARRLGHDSRQLPRPSTNLRGAGGPAARFSSGPPTGSRTATSDVGIAGYRVKADMALLFGRLAVRRVRDFLCAGRYRWTGDGTQRPAIALTATSAQGGGAR
jgi:hypothetical protein